MTLPRRPNIENFPQKSNQTPLAAVRSECVSGRYIGGGVAHCRIASQRNFPYIFPTMMPPVTTRTQKPITVLLADDDIGFAKIVQDQLQQFQNREFKLIWKETVDEALQEIQTNHSIDLIVTDYVFPGTNGLEFCLQLNQMNSEIPIVFLTATRDFKLAIEAMKLGVEDFLIKEDLSESVLPRTILNVLERVRMQKQIKEIGRASCRERV
jgi:PleD family two-component response regulator